MHVSATPASKLQPHTVTLSRCLTKKVAMSVSPACVDFGPGVTLAESANRVFTITNDGALDVEYTLLADVEVRAQGLVWVFNVLRGLRLFIVVADVEVWLMIKAYRVLRVWVWALLSLTWG